MSFSRSLRSLEADGFHRSLPALLLVLFLVAAWLAWFFLARVTVYSITDTARLEANAAVHALQAVVPGRVIAVRMVLGQDVQAGEILVELDSESPRLERDEEKARLAALEPQMNALRAELASVERARSEAREAGSAALEEARARLDEAEAAAQYAQKQAERAARLHAEGHIAEDQMARDSAEAKQRRAAADAFRVAIARLQKDQESDESDRRARLDQLAGEAAAMQGALATSAARVARLQEEIEKRHIRAPVAGRVGEVANLQVGEVVDEFARLGAVVPDGELRIVADFAPPVALGRIQPGQPARMRLNGFPWTQYGSVAARVVRVATEARNGRIRVELEVRADSAFPVPLQHGLPGSVEVEVEKTTPATLALRAAGTLLARPVARENQRVKEAGA